MKFHPSILLFALLPGVLQAASPVELARRGEALLPIYVEPDAPGYVIETAKMLAGKLRQMTGAEFHLVHERPEAGILFTAPERFPAPLKEAAVASEWDESYRLLTHDGSLYLTGEGEHSTRNAAYRLLYLLGYRQFFPGAVWEVVPSKPDLAIGVDEARSPAFIWRDMFYAVRRKPEILINATELPRSLRELDDWKRKNLADSRFLLRSGHSLHGLIQRHRAEFRAHPEWLTTLEMSAQGKNFEPKFLVQNESLVKLIEDDAVTWLRQNPESASYSVEPSDRGGWPKESPIGSPSDQTVTLANAVARRLAAEGIPRKVAFFAYNRHSSPPTLPLEPGIVVSVTTNFIQGVPIRRLLTEWKKKGAEIGVRDYASVWFSDFSLPGNPYMIASPTYFLKALRGYHQLGVRYYGTEASSGGWLSYGLGMYAATQAFWDPKEVDYEAVYRDFLDSAFGKSAAAVQPFFERIRGENGPILSEGFYHELYSTLTRAAAAAETEAVKTRIAQLVAYVRYVELMDATRQAPEGAIIAAYEELARYAVRCRTFPTVPVAEVFGRIGYTIRIWDQVAPAVDRVLKNPEAIWTTDELLHLAGERVEVLAPIPFTPRTYSTEVTTLAVGAPATAVKPYRFASRQILHWLAKEPGETLELTLRNISTLDPRQSVYIALISHDDPDGNPLMTETVAKSDEPITLRLKATDAGLHDIEIRDAAGETELDWPIGTPISVPAGAALTSAVKGTYEGWIYIPAGVALVGGHAAPSEGSVLDADGKELFRFDRLKQEGYFSFDVPAEAQGRFAKLKGISGKVKFLTIPPYLARAPQELLLPKEIVNTDEKR